ncbi:MAG: PIG-L family deacetylase, partial [Armatimonadetes bacterium]|nr:PIG-L family deacetylase [Armatimonadota bacterium]
MPFFQSNPRVVALMPHPDDIEILCAGTLLRLKESGAQIHLATMTAGDKGSATHPRQEIAAIRRAEAQNAAQILGAASYSCLEFSDLEITFDNESRRRVSEFLREIDPFLVFTTPPAD